MASFNFSLKRLHPENLLLYTEFQNLSWHQATTYGDVQKTFQNVAALLPTDNITEEALNTKELLFIQSCKDILDNPPRSTYDYETAYALVLCQKLNQAVKKFEESLKRDVEGPPKQGLGHYVPFSTPRCLEEWKALDLETSRMLNVKYAALRKLEISTCFTEIQQLLHLFIYSITKRLPVDISLSEDVIVAEYNRIAPFFH